VITGTAEYTDERGVAQSLDVVPTTLTVIQPVKSNRWKAVIPALFAFVAGSAKVDGQPFTPLESAGILTFEIGKTLNEGESVMIE
jgi:hypothetical protein